MTRAERIQRIEHLEQHYKNYQTKLPGTLSTQMIELIVPLNWSIIPQKDRNPSQTQINKLIFYSTTDTKQYFFQCFWYGLLHTNNRVICMHHSKRYSKDLTHLTTFRISPALREKAERAAEWCGISFSDFVRQSITRNILVSRSIEEEVTRKTAMVVMGYKE